jgi:hypothetical protein
MWNLRRLFRGEAEAGEGGLAGEADVPFKPRMGNDVLQRRHAHLFVMPGL